MKLLVVTQAVNENDPILGFFCGWLAEFSKRAERITVIANAVGEHTLPANVVVHSLGKERGASRLSRIARFVKLVAGLRADYDAILIHMTPEYALAAAPIARLTGKPLYLWYNHPERGPFLRLALPWVRRAFYTSPDSASAAFSRAERMPVGIDGNLFSPMESRRDPLLIYMQGRVSASKRVDVALSALRMLRTHGTPARLRIVGPVVHGYGERLKKEFKDLVEVGAVEFTSPIPNRLTPAEYRSAAVSVNLAREGHFDKSALEAMACETPVIVGSRTFEGLVHDEWIVRDFDAKRLADALGRFFALPKGERAEVGKLLRERVMREHGLPALAERLFKAMRVPRGAMDPKRFYDSVSPEKFGPDYEKARWDSSPIAQAQYRMTEDAIRRFLPDAFRKARSVLEIGPGPGTWTKLLMERNPDASYTLVDISKAMLDQARAALPGKNISFLEDGWLEFKPSAPADFFFSSRAIEYVNDKAEAARVVERALARGGSGVIVTKMPKPFFDWLRGRGTALHRGQIGPSALARALAASGLTVTGTTAVAATFPLLRSASVNASLYAFLKHLPFIFPLTLFAESYAVGFKKS